MSYYEEEGVSGLGALGALDSGTSFPAGSEFGVGYQVTGLPSAAAPGAVQVLRDSVAYGFRGTIVAVQWGPAFGVPSGVLAVKIRTGLPLSGAQLNSIFSDVGNTFQSRLRAAGSTSAVVRNSHLHQIGSTSASLPTSDPVASLLSTFGMSTTPVTPTGIDPATGMPYGTMLPPAENFFTQSIGGIPMWGILVGGTVAVGAVAYVMMSKPKTTANGRRGRRVRRNKHFVSGQHVKTSLGPATVEEVFGERVHVRFDRGGKKWMSWVDVHRNRRRR
jgi:hypothetical protein